MPQPTDIAPKPYKLVSLPQEAPNRQKPVGHDVLKKDKLTGSISLEMTVQTALFVASGAIALGTDVIKNPSIPKPSLIKVAVTKDDKLLIPGSSFKGVVRSTYEAITGSCLCKTQCQTISNVYKECRDKTKLCPACRVFGAMDWQGLISFNDAFATAVQSSVGFMPSLYGPRSQSKEYKRPGRKFYYHAAKAVEKTQNNGICVQQASKNQVFATELQFKNLSEAELGTLLVVLGQDLNNPFTLKIGGGKPIGMGTMSVKVTQIIRPADLRARYSSYDSPPSDSYTQDRLTKEIKRLIGVAHTSNYIQAAQLTELKDILKWPSNRVAPSGMY